MGFPVAAAAVVGAGGLAAGFGVAYVYQHKFDKDVLGRLDGTPADLKAALHYNDRAAGMAMFGVQGLGAAIAWVGAKGDAPGAIVFGIGMMAVAAGAQVGWALAEHQSTLGSKSLA